MAKPPKPARVARRSELARLDATRKAQERRRAIRLVAVCGALALALLAYPVYLFGNDYRARNAPITDFGPPATAAACDPISSNPASGNQEHVAEGTKITYSRSPPDSGAHYDSPAPFARHFYTTADRPSVETLVHNLEHGYAIAWYQADAPADQVATLADIARTFGSENSNIADKFIAAPWSSMDGAGFPEEKTVVLTRWTADPADRDDASKQRGVRQSCGQVSGEAIAGFMATYPVDNSPEPYSP